MALRCSAVLFDLDGTLLDEELSARCGLTATCSWASALTDVSADRIQAAAEAVGPDAWLALDTEGYHAAFGITWEEVCWGQFGPETEAHHPVLSREHRRYRTAIWRSILASVGVDDPAVADAVAERHAAERAATHLLFPHALRVLGTLAPSFRLGLVTNGPRDLQMAKLERARPHHCASATGTVRLLDLLDPIVISGEVGFHKPNPALFRVALERCGVGPSQAVYVGDSQRRDLCGATAAGIQTVWVNRTGAALLPGVPPPAAQISCLEQLPPLLLAP